MGLASALSTSLTGLKAAETTIDVVGNNLANSQTVGFKASEAFFATQFLQTLCLSSGPTQNTGGTNPRQVGRGTQVAEITPNFTQGTLEISSSASDLAIQGEGFFVVEAVTGERLYTRNGIFKINSENQLVTITGNRLLGHGVDENFQIQSTTLVPLEIPLGSAAVAQATQNVFLSGTLTPTGDITDTAGVIESAVLGDAVVPRPDVSASGINVAPLPDITGTSVVHLDGGGTHTEGDTFRYRFTFVDAVGTESPASPEIVETIPVGDTLPNNAIQLTSLPPSAEYTQINIYRTAAGGSSFVLLDSVAAGAVSYTDDNSTALSATPLDTTTINGNYSYLITHYLAGAEESRPSLVLGPQSVSDSRVQLTNLPTPPVPPPGGGFPAYNQIRIYRNLASDANTYYLVDTVSPGSDYTDSRTDAAISDLTNPANQVINLDGPAVDSNTLLTDMLLRDGLDYNALLQTGTLEFSGSKGGAPTAIPPKEFQITSTSTLQELTDFMEDALGIQLTNDDPTNPIPGSVNNIPGELGTLTQGAVIQNGRIRIVSNNGIDNEVSIDSSAFLLRTTAGAVLNPILSFGSLQDAVGQSVSADMLVFDSLGIPLNVQVTAILESRTGTSTTYRWFADSDNNDPTTGVDITVGTGQVIFDGDGEVISVTNGTVTIDRPNIASNSPLEFVLDFSSVRGLAEGKATLQAARQDGSAAGTLASFIVGEDGIVRGVFTNGVTRDLGAIRLARFSNNAGLVQSGQNMFASSVNSGLPQEGNPGAQGVGTIIAGSVELSNTDIGSNLIDLVLATTQYRGNARVITATQQLLDELLNLRR